MDVELTKDVSVSLAVVGAVLVVVVSTSVLVVGSEEEVSIVVAVVIGASETGITSSGSKGDVISDVAVSGSVCGSVGNNEEVDDGSVADKDSTETTSSGKEVAVDGSGSVVGESVVKTRFTRGDSDDLIEGVVPGDVERGKSPRLPHTGELFPGVGVTTRFPLQYAKKVWIIVESAGSFKQALDLPTRDGWPLPQVKITE